VLNLDKKRQTLKKLRDKGKSNFLLFLPCFIAYFFVSAYYFFALHLDMLLSDKEGRFLGIEKHGKANKYAASSHSSNSAAGNRGAVNSAAKSATAKRVTRGDDYVTGGSRVKTGARLVSAFLMVCFAFTFLPTLGVDFGLNLNVAAESAQGAGVGALEAQFQSFENPDVPGETLYYRISEVEPVLSAKPLNGITWGDPKMSVGWGSAQLNIVYDDEATPATKTPYNGIRLRVDGVLVSENFLDPSNLEKSNIVSNLTPASHQFVLEAYWRPEHLYRKVESTVIVGTTNITDTSGNVIGNENVTEPKVEFVELPGNTANYRVYKLSEQTGVLTERPGYPGNVTAVYSGTGATVTWNQSATEGTTGIDGYIVSRRDLDNPGSQLVQLQPPVVADDSPSYTYTDTATLGLTTRYEYVVSAFKGINTSYTFANFSEANRNYFTFSDTSADNDETRDDMYTKTAKPIGITGSTLSNGYRIDWSAVEKADNYEVYVFENPTDMTTAAGSLTGGTPVSGALSPTGNYYFVDTFSAGYYIIRACRTVNGVPMWSDPETFVIDPSDTANPPTNLRVLPNTNSVYIEWDDPNVDPPTPPNALLTKQYVITGTHNGVSHEKTLNAPVAMPYQLTSFDDRVRVNDGENWTFTVRALKSATAVSIESNDDSAVVGKGVRAPEPSATPEADGAITISWLEIPEADYYTVSYKHNNNASDTGSSPQLEQLYYRFEGLADNATSYVYTVTAYKEYFNPGDLNGQGKMNVSVQSASRSYPFNDLPKVPSAPYAQLNGTSAAVTWDAVTSAKYNVIGYQIVGTAYDASGSPTGDTISYNTPVGTTVYNHNNLQENITWKYKVAVRVTIGAGTDEYLGAYSTESNGVTVIPLILLPPTDPQATATVNSITVSWNASPSANVDGYVIYGGLTSGSLQRVGSSTTNSFTHSNLGIGETWYYYVKSFRNKIDYTVEESPRSTDVVNATTGTGGTEGVVFPPTDFRGTVNDNTVDLTWTASRGSADGYYLYVKAGSTVTPTDYTKRYNTTKTAYVHDDPVSGDNSYVLVAYKYNADSGQYLYSEPTEIITKKIGATAEDPGTGGRLAAPLDFLVTTTDGEATLTWKSVEGAYGYRVHATGPTGALVFDRSAVNFTHTPLLNGEKWTYYVTAITPSGTGVIEGVPTQSYTITVGETLNRPVDFVFTAGNRQIDLDWSDVTGAEGYIVYLFNQTTREFVPTAYVTESNYSATGLTNDTEYTFGLAAFKTINGRIHLSPNALPLTAKPTTGTPTDLDRKIAIKGTAPYGMDRSDLMSAHANHGAFDGDVDIYIQTIDSSTKEIQNALAGYGGGLSSFVIYPFDITLYKAGTYIEPVLNPGYTVTITLPIPDELVRYREFIQVMHLDSNGTLENLRSSLAEIEDTWCIQFPVLSFSPFAFVIYKDAIVEAGSGTGSFGVFASNAFGQIVNFPPAMLPFGLRIRRGRRKVYRIVKIRRIR
jgi:hypothetical protein